MTKCVWMCLLFSRGATHRIKVPITFSRLLAPAFIGLFVCCLVDGFGCVVWLFGWFVRSPVRSFVRSFVPPLVLLFFLFAFNQ